MWLSIRSGHSFFGPHALQSAILPRRLGSPTPSLYNLLNCRPLSVFKRVTIFAKVDGEPVGW